MITFKALGQWGRLGNQMFQYATLFSVGKKKNYEIGIPFNVKTNNAYLNLFLDECFEKLSAKDCTSVDTTADFVEPFPNIDFNSKIFDIEDNTNLHGYFQSEKYFKEVKKDLREEFTFKQHINQYAEEIRSSIQGEAISLHIRIGDYVYLSDKHPICNQEYYKKALELLPQGKDIILFSDNNDIAAQMIAPFSDKIHIVNTNNHFIDLCLMTKCEYHIIANSSYSWWGAWLAESNKVIAPSKWFGHDENMPKNWNDVYCEDWIVL